MMPENTIKNLLGKEGTIEKVGSNKPFRLDDPDGVWLIEEGAVNVFSIPLQDGEIVGQHNHLFKAETGQAIFGIHFSNTGSGLGLLAVGVSGTTLRKVKRSQLNEIARAAGNQEMVAELFDRWVQGLTSGVTGDEIVPKEAVQLEAGKQVELAAGGSACAKKEIVWMKPLKGEAQFFGNKEWSFAANGVFFPLSLHLWVQTEQPAQIRCLSTRELLQQDPQWKSLEYFHQFVFKRLEMEKEKELQEEGQRYKEKGVSDHIAVQNAFSQLASILKEKSKGAPVFEGSHDRLLDACRLVGGALGLTIKEHPELRKKKAVKDPLRVIARFSRIRLRQVILKDDWWKEDNGPLLAKLEETSEPVALLPTSPTQYEMVNPADGSRVKVTDEVAGKLSGIAHTFYRPFAEKVLHLKDVLKFASRGLKRDLVAVVILGILIGLLGILTPLATGKIFDSIIPGAEKMQLLQLTMALIVAAIATGAFTVARSIAIQRVSGKMDSSIQAAVWDRLLNLPAPFFRDYSSGDLAARAGGMNAITQVLSGTVVTAILGGIFGLFNLALLFYYSVKLAFIACLLVAVALGVFAFASRYQLRYQAGLVQRQGEISGMVLQFIANGISKLRVAGAEDRAFAKWAAPFTEQKKLDYRSRTLTNWITIFQSVFPVICTFVIFIFVARLLFGGTSSSAVPQQTTFSTGSFLAFNAAFTSFLTAALTMGTTFISCLLIVPYYKRMKPILETLPEVDEAKGDPGELTGEIDVENITFRYKKDGPLVLDRVSFRAAEGEFIAMVGPSGSGKSTLMRLLLGFEKPASGSIYFNGQDLSTIDLRAVRSQIGVVLQNGKLLSGDIFTNIVGSSPLTQEDAWEAIRMAGMEKDIEQMPMQLFTVVSEGGSTLSGGQRQRLMIARAIVKKPRLLIFDEATSALDNETQNIVSKSLENLKATRIVIAHRLSTIQKADRIYVIVAGRVVQEGTYDDLIKKEGPFLELVKRQIA